MQLTSSFLSSTWETHSEGCSASRVSVGRDRRSIMNRTLTLAIIFVLLGGRLVVHGDENPGLAAVPLPEGLVAKDTVAETAATVCFLEGPAVDAQGNVFFSDIAGNRILRMTPQGKVSIFRAD